MYSLAILQIVDPSCFFCEILKETVSKEYEQLFAELNLLYSMVYRDVEELKPATLPFGTFCVVFSEEQKSWCRAILESTTCSGEGELVHCFLLDYAVYCPIKKSNIRFPVKECEKLPFRAKKFRLHKICPVSLRISAPENKMEMRLVKSWDIAAIDYFRQLLTESRKIEAQLHRVEDSCMAVDLYITTTDSVICANDDLVAKKYACYENGKPIQRTEYCEAAIASARMLQNRCSIIPLTEKQQEPVVVSSPGQTLQQKCNSLNQETGRQLLPVLSGHVVTSLPRWGSQSKFPISMSLECGRKPTQIWGEHTNLLQMVSLVGFEPGTEMQRQRCNDGGFRVQDPTRSRTTNPPTQEASPTAAESSACRGRSHKRPSRKFVRSSAPRPSGASASGSSASRSRSPGTSSDQDSDPESDGPLDLELPGYQSTIVSLIEAVNQSLQVDEEPVTSSTDNSVSFKRTKRTHRVFANHPEFQDIVQRHSERPDKRFQGQRSLESKYRFSPDLHKQWTESPPVDPPVSCLSSKTVLSMPDGSSIKDPTDRLVDSLARSAFEDSFCGLDIYLGRVDTFSYSRGLPRHDNMSEKLPAQRRGEDGELIKERRSTDSQNEKPLDSFTEERWHSENVVVMPQHLKDSEISASVKIAACSLHSFLHPAWCKADPEQILRTEAAEKPSSGIRDAEIQPSKCATSAQSPKEKASDSVSKEHQICVGATSPSDKRHSDSPKFKIMSSPDPFLRPVCGKSDLAQKLHKEIAGNTIADIRKYTQSHTGMTPSYEPIPERVNGNETPNLIVLEKPQTSESDTKVESDLFQFMWPAWSNRDLSRRLSTARIRVNGELSQPIKLARGTRQGCPLSPLLFALAVEPLAAKIRQSDGVPGFRYGSVEEKIALYADDILLFLADPDDSLKGAIEIIERFGALSGLKINWDKSVLFDVDGVEESGSEPLGEGRLKVASHFKYLGIWISVPVTEFLYRNLTPLMGVLKAKVDVWNKLHLSVPQKIMNPEHAVFVSKLLAPCSTMDDTSLCTEIKKRLIMRGYDEPNLTESYCWPPIAEGFDTLVICPDGSNPIYYLPPLLTYLSCASMAYKLLPAKYGPHAVIVCPGWNKARSVYNLLMEFSKCIRPLSPMLLLVGLKKDDIESINFRKPCEVIVTTPHCLLRCMEHHGLLLLRLCHLVFDEVDVLFTKAGAEMSEVLQMHKKIVSVENREGTPQQIVAVGSKWIHETRLLLQYMPTPRIVFTRMEQAAVFANVQQIIHLCMDCDKMSVLLQCLDYTPVDAQKFIIYTKHDAEAELVHKAVQTASVYSLLLHSSLVHNFSNVLEQWKKSCSHRSVMVLVVTDDFAPLLEITDATCIVHYSFPENVGVLSLRLFSLLDYIQCKIDTISMDEDDYSRAKSVLLMTEKHAGYAIDLLQSFQQAQAKVPPELVALAQGLSHAQESKKLDQELCPHLKILGYCNQDEYACPHRHHINPVLDLHSGVPAIPEIDPYITVVPLCIADATRFLGRVVTKNDPYVKFAEELNEYYESSMNKVSAQKVERNHLYAISDGSEYHRVRVLSTKTMDSVSFAHVQYIDDGNTDEIPVHTLFLLPPAFQSLPPQFREFIVCRLKPIDSEDTWDPKVTRIIGRSIRGKQHRAKVVLHLGGIYWLDPMVQVTPLSDLSSCVYDLNVRQEILSTGLGADNPQHIVQLKALLEHGGSSPVSDNSEEIDHDEAPEKSTEDVSPPTSLCLRIAHADHDCHNAVSVPHLLPHSDEEGKQLREVVGQRDPEAPRTPLSASEGIENDEPPEKSTEDVSPPTSPCLGIADAEHDGHKVVSDSHLSPHSDEEGKPLKEVTGQRDPEAPRTPLSASLYPVIKWFEKEDSVILTVKLPEMIDPKCTFYSNRLVFSCNAGGKHYMADMDLYKDIVRDKSTCKLKNGEAVITIEKSTAEMWNRLLRHKHPNVSFDFDHLGDSEEDKVVFSGFGTTKKCYEVVSEDLVSSEYSDSDSD
ncbi:putative ATP-dependent RNA helicase TDRD12 [Ranitomeya imitator]|uniref:putative ATP-dependent RNA helicase TDRD12 n=1 Tax=Ranitomeya imitator TaxID=111125 RepID=UPI0037E8F0D4